MEEAESYFEPIIKIRRDKKRLIHALDLTLQGCFAQKWNVRFVCFGSAAEVILNYGEKDELTEALANAYAVLVPGDNSKKEFKRLYGVRSNIVHGNVKKLKDAEANIQNLSAFEDMIRVLWKTILCDNGLMDMLEKSDKERETWFGTTRGETMTLHPQFVVDAKGKKKSVLLSYKEYEELLELAQDSIDAKMIEEAKDEPRVPWEQVKSKVQASRL
ncbi:MAG: hypothetical protein HZC51_01990 [Nitrospirae bacterium]|nr:hypothetical protein [Nitrospirota bacterium]